MTGKNFYLSKASTFKVMYHLESLTRKQSEENYNTNIIKLIFHCNAVLLTFLDSNWCVYLCVCSVFLFQYTSDSKCCLWEFANIVSCNLVKMFCTIEYIPFQYVLLLNLDSSMYFTSSGPVAPSKRTWHQQADCKLIYCCCEWCFFNRISVKLDFRLLL